MHGDERLCEQCSLNGCLPPGNAAATLRLPRYPLDKCSSLAADWSLGFFPMAEGLKIRSHALSIVSRTVATGEQR